MKTFIAAISVLVLSASPMLAQMATPEPTAGGTATPSLTISPPVTFYSQRGDFRISKIMGTKVSNASGEIIGEIDDVLLNADGTAAAIIVGVGGFLGMGERHAAVSFSSVQLSRDAKDLPIARVNVTKEELKSAPEWKWLPVAMN